MPAAAVVSRPVGSHDAAVSDFVRSERALQEHGQGRMTGPPTHEAAPGEEAAPVQMTRTKVYTEGTTDPRGDRDATAQWALTFLRQVGAHPLPLYGSEDFTRSAGLVQLASAVRAAEAWRESTDAHVLAAQLDMELQAAWRHDEMDYERWREVAARVRHQADTPSHAELQRRRAS